MGSSLIRAISIHGVSVELFLKLMHLLILPVLVSHAVQNGIVTLHFEVASYTSV